MVKSLDIGLFSERDGIPGPTAFKINYDLQRIVDFVSGIADSVRTDHGSAVPPAPAPGTDDYDELDNKPTITEQDLGVRGDQTFGPLGTSTTVTVEGDKSQADYLDQPFSSIEIDRIIAMAESAGPM